MENHDMQYMPGFGNHFATEALPGALPIGRNSPQRPPYGLIAELLSGTAFTAPRHENQRSWLYRIRPSVMQGAFRKIDPGLIRSAPCEESSPSPQQLRWNPLPDWPEDRDIIDGMVTFLTNGDASMRSGSAVHLYACTRSMQDEVFYNADGDYLFVPQQGRLRFTTEMGQLIVEPTEIIVIPRGVKFKVALLDASAKGYLLEVYGQRLELPGLGPIGSNGLANPRDFASPVACYEDLADRPHRLRCKYAGQLFESQLNHSPFDVVAWHGNYAPYKYDLKQFNTINTVSFDHPDPSIFTVLTSQTERSGTANVDFVIFPPRWMVAEDTFRPPYFHRNMMSEYMGLIHGVYDAKPAGGFEPGGGSLHSCMSPHGPEAAAFEQASQADLKPEYQDATLAFMFESSYLYKPTRFAMEAGLLQDNYHRCWEGIKPTFDPKKP
ncbi:MAG: homogentisate 1,2-dioxygenase [Oligoflexus sp.]